MERPRRLEFLHVDVGFVEAVEEHQPVGTCAVEFAGEMGERGIERR